MVLQRYSVRFGSFGWLIREFRRQSGGCSQPCAELLEDTSYCAASSDKVRLDAGTAWNSVVSDKMKY